MKSNDNSKRLKGNRGVDCVNCSFLLGLLRKAVNILHL